MASWKKDEISMFYDAYRKHGKDWQKVAADVGTKSIETVKSFYHLNWAYLSLPSGLTSVSGLIATMERNGIRLVSSQKSVERNISNDLFQSPSVATNENGFSGSKSHVPPSASEPLGFGQRHDATVDIPLDTSNIIKTVKLVKDDNHKTKVIHWTPEEHRDIWKAISQNCLLNKKTPVQIASHAQKYYKHLKDVKERRLTDRIHETHDTPLNEIHGTHYTSKEDTTINDKLMVIIRTSNLSDEDMKKNGAGSKWRVPPSASEPLGIGQRHDATVDIPLDTSNGDSKKKGQELVAVWEADVKRREKASASVEKIDAHKRRWTEQNVNKERQVMRRHIHDICIEKNQPQIVFSLNMSLSAALSAEDMKHVNKLIFLLEKYLKSSQDK